MSDEYKVLKDEGKRSKNKATVKKNIQDLMFHSQIFERMHKNYNSYIASCFEYLDKSCFEMVDPLYHKLSDKEFEIVENMMKGRKAFEMITKGLIEFRDEYQKQKKREAKIMSNKDKVWQDKNGYRYIVRDDVDGKWHLIRDDKEITENMKCASDICYVLNYYNDDWAWEDGDGYWHLVRDGKELTKGLKCIGSWSFRNGDWSYEDEDEYWHLMRDGRELTKGMKCVNVFSNTNGDWKWMGENNEWHKVKKGAKDHEYV